MKITQSELWPLTGFAQVISLIGAGGKTTCLKRLSTEIHASGRSVVATTTTKVYPDNSFQTWQHPVMPPAHLVSSTFWYAALDARSGKWLGPATEIVDEAIRLEQDECGLKRCWVIEADGAKEKKLKLWSSHEPQIPLHSECAVLVVSASLWNSLLAERDIHRAERWPSLVGERFDRRTAWNYIISSPVFYPKYNFMNWVVFFNNPVGAPAEDLLTDLNVGIPSEDFPAGCPAHLRIAAGCAREGSVKWFDLW